MANSTTSLQIPQHVSALLSHLTSRPGVQSTLILSRRDGSIIQTTGLLGPPKPTRSETSSPAPAPAGASTEDASTTTTTATPPSPQTETQEPSITSPTSTSTQTKTYQPSAAETLAAHIFAFVSSASNLSFSLSHPQGETAASSNGIHESGLGNGSRSATGSAREDGEGEGLEGLEGQEDDEVKLLRLRTKKHEIVVVPDRKYLLCVVQDATPSAAGGAASGTGMGGRSSR